MSLAAAGWRKQANMLIWRENEALLNIIKRCIRQARHLKSPQSNAQNNVARLRAMPEIISKPDAYDRLTIFCVWRSYRYKCNCPSLMSWAA